MEEADSRYRIASKNAEDMSPACPVEQSGPFLSGRRSWKNPHVKPCCAYMKGAFGDRFEMFEGDSSHVIPWLSTHRGEICFDIVHVDGNHGVPLCRADISGCLSLHGPGQHLLLDDTGASQIMDVHWEYVFLGYLTTETMGATCEGHENTLARVSKP